MSRERAIEAATWAFEGVEDPDTGETLSVSEGAQDALNIGVHNLLENVFDAAHGARAIFYAPEVGDLQFSEAELVSEPLHEKINQLEHTVESRDADLRALSLANGRLLDTEADLKDEVERLRSDNEQLGKALDSLIAAVTNLTDALKRGL